MGTIGCSTTADLEPVATAQQREAAGSTRTITILHVNDTHSHLEADGPRDLHLDGTLGGLVKAASVIHSLKASHPGALLVHAGDLFQEDVYFATTRGVAELTLLREGLGLDVMTLGNHEFAFTPAALVQVLAAAFPGDAPPVVTANLDYRNTSLAGLDAFVRPNVVKEVDGVRVGFFGLAIPDPAEQFPAPAGVPPAIDSDFLGVASRQVAALREAGADAVVLLSHLGLALDEAIARSVPGIDAIVGGHDHLLAKEVVAGPGGKPVLIAHAGEFYEWVGKLTLTVEGREVAAVDEELIPVDAETPRSPPFAETVADLQRQANTTFGEELFHAPIALALADVAQYAPPGRPQRDSPVADLIADALRYQGRTDVGLTANGFLTEGLHHGFLVREDAFRIVGDGFDPDDPFGRRLGFPLFRIQLTGNAFLQAIEMALAVGGDFFPQVSGMRVAYCPDEPSALRMWIGGEPLDPARSYSATVHLGLLLGLEGILGAPIDAEPLGVTEYEAVRDWLAREEVVLYRPEGRVLEYRRGECGSDARGATLQRP